MEKKKHFITRYAKKKKKKKKNFLIVEIVWGTYIFSYGGRNASYWEDMYYSLLLIIAMWTMFCLQEKWGSLSFWNIVNV